MARPVGVLFIGAHGAVASTTIAGARAVARGLAEPRGTITTSPLFDGIQLVGFDDLVFGGWDINVGKPLRDVVRRHGLVSRALGEQLAEDLDAIEVWPGIVTHLSETIRALGRGAPLAESSARRAVEQVAADIDRFRRERGVEQVVVVNTCSTEQQPVASPAFESLAAFERAIDIDAPELTNGMLYGYAALRSGCAFVNFTPSTTVELPALHELARRQGLPLAGQDGKTGQTLYKTVLAPMLRIRGLRLLGWYSTNILGNDDGLVLEDPKHGATKIQSKSSVLESILGYDDFAHRVRIDYYPPRGDRKEAWDTIDFEGWLGERMTMRIDWQGSDSMLAAPLIVDLVRLAELAWRHGESGPVVPLAMFFKSPSGTSVHDFFAQYALFERWVEAVRADGPRANGRPAVSTGGTQSASR